MQSIIEELVDPHQTCGIKGRTIFTNTHIARNVLECSDDIKDRVAMFELDLAKAFDRVSHEELFSMLQYCKDGSIVLEGV